MTSSFIIKSHKLCRDIFVDVDKIFLYVLCAFMLELACTCAMHTIFIYINFKSQTKIKIKKQKIVYHFMTILCNWTFSLSTTFSSCFANSILFQQFLQSLHFQHSSLDSKVVQYTLLSIVMNLFKTCSASITKIHNSRSNKHN